MATAVGGGGEPRLPARRPLPGALVVDTAVRQQVNEIKDDLVAQVQHVQNAQSAWVRAAAAKDKDQTQSSEWAFEDAVGNAKATAAEMKEAVSKIVADRINTALKARKSENMALNAKKQRGSRNETPSNRTQRLAYNAQIDSQTAAVNAACAAVKADAEALGKEFDVAFEKFEVDMKAIKNKNRFPIIEGLIVAAAAVATSMNRTAPPQLGDFAARGLAYPPVTANRQVLMWPVENVHPRALTLGGVLAAVKERDSATANGSFYQHEEALRMAQGAIADVTYTEIDNARRAVTQYWEGVRPEARGEGMAEELRIVDAWAAVQKAMDRDRDGARKALECLAAAAEAYPRDPWRRKLKDPEFEKEYERLGKASEVGKAAGAGAGVAGDDASSSSSSSSGDDDDDASSPGGGGGADSAGDEEEGRERPSAANTACADAWAAALAYHTFVIGLNGAVLHQVGNTEETGSILAIIQRADVLKFSAIAAVQEAKTAISHVSSSKAHDDYDQAQEMLRDGEKSQRAQYAQISEYAAETAQRELANITLHTAQINDTESPTSHIQEVEAALRRVFSATAIGIAVDPDSPMWSRLEHNVKDEYDKTLEAKIEWKHAHPTGHEAPHGPPNATPLPSAEHGEAEKGEGDTSAHGGVADTKTASAAEAAAPATPPAAGSGGVAGGGGALPPAAGPEAAGGGGGAGPGVVGEEGATPTPAAGAGASGGGGGSVHKNPLTREQAQELVDEINIWRSAIEYIVAPAQNPTPSKAVQTKVAEWKGGDYKLKLDPLRTTQICNAQGALLEQMIADLSTFRKKYGEDSDWKRARAPYIRPILKGDATVAFGADADIAPAPPIDASAIWAAHVGAVVDAAPPVKDLWDSDDDDDLAHW